MVEIIAIKEGASFLGYLPIVPNLFLVIQNNFFDHIKVLCNLKTLKSIELNTLMPNFVIIQKNIVSDKWFT